MLYSAASLRGPLLSPSLPWGRMPSFDRRQVIAGRQGRPILWNIRPTPSGIALRAIMKRWDGIWKITSPLIKHQGPDGNIHEGWCGIFLHEVLQLPGQREKTPRQERRQGRRRAKLNPPAKHRELAEKE